MERCDEKSCLFNVRRWSIRINAGFTSNIGSTAYSSYFLLSRNTGRCFPERSQSFFAKAGHYIGLHGETHDYDTLYEKGKYVSEMQSVQKKIHTLTQLTPHLTRPPYGSTPGITKKMASAIHATDFRVWDWSIDSMDWYYKDSAKEVANTVIRRAERPFEIILLHEQPQAIKALEAIVAGLQKKGYQFAIYDEDFHIPYNFAQYSNL
ncbi:polysaccharide deacetylase family protein [Exiguobacterium sp. SL14]|nr:polysaccharide deacetylase family protein [Exiguobacterium sp. SL14]MCY1692240.1 polysaccharide deacetylase family protein [Exiguobacterium sp. SL14]